MSTDSELSLAQNHLAMARRLGQEIAAQDMLTVPPSTAYQEPTIAWNAARNHLPYVQLGALKINSPGVINELDRHEEPNEKPVVEVIGANHLLSHETQDKPVEAVRVVHLSLDSRQRQARSLHSSAPTHPQVQAPQTLLGSILTDPALDVPLGGFVMVGNVDLFGVPGLGGQFEKWQGPAPSNVIVFPNQPISIERVTLPKDFQLPTVISELGGSAFDNITFRNVSVYYQNYRFDTTKPVGWHFSADLVINEACGPLRDVLSKALGVSEPTLGVYMFLGRDGGWHKPPSLHSFTLEGIFPGLAVKPASGIVFSKIAVRAFGIRTMKYDPTPRSALDFGCSVFGGMNLDVPGSVLPLTLDYEIREYSGTVSLVASRDSWKDPLGAHGLVLSGVSFTTSFPLSSPWKSVAFDVSANLKYQDVSTILQGTYFPRGTFQLQAPIHHVTLGTINTLFRLVSGDDLALPDLDVSIGTASLTLSSDHGFGIALERVTIADYTSPDASLAITPNGASLHGKLTTDVVQFGDVEVKGAFLRVTFERKGSAKATDVIVGGTVEFSTMTFPAAVYLYKSPDLSVKPLEWTVLASLTAGNEALALSKVVPEVEGTQFDLPLTQAVFVAASRDDPNLGNMITSGFTFHQGVQVCAAVGQINALNSLMHSPVPGLTLSAGWSKEKGFDLQVLMPTPTRLYLGNGVTTTPFTLSIATKPGVELILSAGLMVHVAHSPTPLLFTSSLGAGVTGAEATGQMSGWWVNPLGLSPNVKVGPNLELSISIMYEQFEAAGPPKFKIHGGITLGQTQAQLTLSISEDPMEQLLSGRVQLLNITDVADFASAIIDAHIPQPPRELFDFQNVRLRISPAAVDIDKILYPRGFSFRSDAILFGKKAGGVKCMVDTGKISIQGAVESFALGSLTVLGAADSRANFDCELGPVDQRLLIDGIVLLFGWESPTRVVVDLLPTPKIEWLTPLKFTDLLAFQLRASLVGPISFTDLSDVDFKFDSVLEQIILQYIHDQLMGQFDQAWRTVKDGIDVAQKDVEKAEAAWKGGIKEAQAALDEAKKAWDEKEESVTTESNMIIYPYNNELEHLEYAVLSAQKNYSTVMADAQTAVRTAERDHAQALQRAQHDVDSAKRQLHDAIDAAQRDVDMAARDFEAAFGAAQAAIEAARGDLQAIQVQINDVHATIREYEDAPWYEFWKKSALPGLYITLAVLEASKAVADANLQVAEAKLASADFLAKKAALHTAQAALEAARHAGQAAIDVAVAALVVADKTSQAALDMAKVVLDVVKVGPEWVALQAAKEALRCHQETHGEAFRAATQALANPTQCVEYIAYQTAQVALELIRATSITIDVAKAALEVARQVGEEAIHIGQWVADHPLDAFEIRAIHLSGSQRDMIGADGSMAKPFAAHIEGFVAGNPLTLDGEFDPSKTADFITFIFKNLWDEIKKAM